MRWPRGWEPGLGHPVTPCKATSPFVSSQPPKETQPVSDPACCCLAPCQKSSLQSPLQRGLRWVLPPKQGPTPSLGRGLPSYHPAAPAPGLPANVPALQGRRLPRHHQEEAALCFGSSGTGTAHTTLDVGALGCLTRAFPRVPCVLLAFFGCRGSQRAVGNNWRLLWLFPLQKMGCSSVLWKTL